MAAEHVRQGPGVVHDGVRGRWFRDGRARDQAVQESVLWGDTARGVTYSRPSGSDCPGRRHVRVVGDIDEPGDDGCGA